MVDRMKTLISNKGWELLLASLLSVIIGILGFGFHRMFTKLDEVSVRIETNKENIDRLEDNQRYLMIVGIKDKDTQKDDREYLREKLYQYRGAIK